ncbi:MULTISPECIES: heavy-metal-associated domain-containing protein [unclassified Microbacterium]|jgi:copper chaperone CopZ|uniref:heavy-metal-associated domain-containing protein n=1 Tax=unclassified Microbacterium TaxID=2609290 RepID=UPI000C2C0D16|nr:MULTISPECIES: cation transporter [unclassified Microbacterium]MDO8381812.1 cation transporter [Microbacterium sp.]
MTDPIDLGLKESTAASCSCCSTATSPATDSPIAVTPAVTEELLVSGMTCGHCVSSVTKELTRLTGVENVTVDLHAGGASRVTIHSSTPINASAVKTAIEEAGYALADN